MARARLLALLLPVLSGVLWPGTVTAAGHLIRITSTLEPARLTIAPGDSVTWRNDDDERRRVRSRSGPVEFDSGDLEPGESFRVRLSAVGTYPYIDERDDDAQRYWGTIVVADGASSDPSDGSAGGDEGADGDGSGIGDGGASAAVTIGMAGRAFGPASVTIAAGGTVTWRNDDDREHTATSTEGVFDSGVLAEGASFRQDFPTTGTFPFLCGIHPDMTGTVSVVAAGTGSGGSDGTAAATPAPIAARVTTRAPVAPGDEESIGAPGTVTIIGLDFAPGTVEVDAGGTVEWRNDDPFAHTTTAADGLFDSGTLEAGDTFAQTFTTPGRFAYTCAIHPSMTGVVVVRAASGAAPTPSPSGPDASSSPSSSPEPETSTGATAFPDATAPPGPQVGAAGGTGTAAADGELVVASLVSTLLALGLIAGALMVATGLLLGLVRRDEGPALP